MNRNKLISRYGETLAAIFLTLKGYRIIERNYRNRLGEIDLVARHKTLLIFIEVKTRTSVRYGLPAEAVTTQKQERIRRIATAYCRQHGISLLESNFRFDVVEVYPPFRIHHIKNCF